MTANIGSESQESDAILSDPHRYSMKKSFKYCIWPNFLS
jgi:hypothetical protein